MQRDNYVSRESRAVNVCREFSCSYVITRSVKEIQVEQCRSEPTTRYGNTLLLR